MGEIFVLRSGFRDKAEALTFYSSQNEPNHFKYSLEIPFEFDIDENEFDQYEMELFKLSEK